MWEHSVADLLSELSRHGQHVPDELIDFALELDKAYIPTRYPNAYPSGSPCRRYTRTEAERLIEYAEQILQFCENLVTIQCRDELVEILREGVQKLSEVLPVKLVVLFGSWAKVGLLPSAMLTF